VISYPTTRRRIVAATILIGGFVLTLIVKIVRGRIETGVPMWVMDSLPNFMCGAVLPFAILTGTRTIRLLDFLLFCGMILLGLVVYEFVQIIMPKRTFELNDLVASVVGVITSVSIGWVFFGRNVQLVGRPHSLEPEGGPDSNRQTSPPTQ
jgi:hypothetical protein